LDGDPVVLFPLNFVRVRYPSISTLILENKVADFGMDLSTYLTIGQLQDEWIIAFDAAALKSMLPDLTIELALSSDTVARIIHRLDSALSGEFSLPGPIIPVERRPLRLRVEPERDACTLQVWTVDEPDAEFSRYETEWGSIVIQPMTFSIDSPSVVPASESLVLTIGRKYGVAVVDPSTGFHARELFTHDGEERHLKLSEGLKIVGGVDQTSACGVAGLDVGWEFVHGDGAPTFWKGQVRAIPVDEFGRFSFWLPNSIPHTTLAPDSMPRFLRLSFEASGYQGHLFEAQVVGMELDVGSLQLARKSPDLILNAGHGLEASELSFQSVEVFDGFETVGFEILSAAPCSDGTLEVFLNKQGDRVRSFRSGGVSWGTWSTEGHDEIVVTVSGHAGHAYEMLADGHYGPVVSSEHSLRMVPRVGVASADDRLLFGWEWRSIRHQVGALHTRSLEEPVDAKIIAPKEGAHLWWGLEGEKEALSTRPMADAMTVVVP
jgi:hypothetical protein